MFVKKLKLEPSCTLLCIYPEGPLNIPRRYVCLDAYCCTDHSSQETEAASMPINRRVCKENADLDKIGFYGRIKKNEMLTFAETWMKLEIIILSKINRTWDNKPHLFPHMGTLHFNLCVIQLMCMNSSPCVCRPWKYKGATPLPLASQSINLSEWMKKGGGERKKGSWTREEKQIVKDGEGREKDVWDEIRRENILRWGKWGAWGGRSNIKDCSAKIFEHLEREEGQWKEEEGEK